MAEVSDLSTANTDFALELYRRRADSTSSDDNMFMSPLSISMALAMTYLGARNKTKRQMSDVLRFDQVDEDEVHETFSDIRQALDCSDQPYTLLLANRLFSQKTHKCLEEYLQELDEHYGASLQPVDYISGGKQAASLINRWVADITDDEITDIIPPGVLSSLTRLVLVNAVYFKGDWKEKFDPRSTKTEDFHVSSSETIRVQTMHASQKYFLVGSSQLLDAEALSLPYAGDTLDMIVVLPQQTSCLEDLEDDLTADDIADAVETFNMSRQKIDVSLPRFRIDDDLELSKILAEMGMKDAFKRGHADFSGIDGSKALYLSEVFHRAVIDVNEDGTVAAAATACSMVWFSSSRPREFRADRPFMFFIQDRDTKSVLFMGRVVRPE